jgi:hypothetical protein
LHALPFAYRDVPGRSGVSVAITITGGASGTWTLQHRDRGWDIDEGDLIEPTTAVTMADEIAWRLFFNALSLPQALSVVRLTGDTALALPLLRARSVIV